MPEDPSLEFQPDAPVQGERVLSQARNLAVLSKIDLEEEGAEGVC